MINNKKISEYTNLLESRSTLQNEINQISNKLLSFELTSDTKHKLLSDLEHKTNKYIKLAHTIGKFKFE